jgi:hypothetical protein
LLNTLTYAVWAVLTAHNMLRGSETFYQALLRHKKKCFLNVRLLVSKFDTS